MGGSENNLFNPEYSYGDLSKIQWFVDILSTVCVWVVSIVGFAIVMSAIMKQALHALYATNSKFWDKVDEVHQNKVSQLAGEIKNGNQISASLGFVINLLLGFLPNVKKLTEFDDQEVDAKTFFTKALPVTCVYIFIGVFVFYGYTTQFGEKFSQGATAFLDNFFLRVDPVEWASKLPTKIARQELSTDGSQLPFDKSANTVAKKAIAAAFSNLKDVTKEKQVDVGKDIEQWVIESMSQESRKYAENPDKYKMSVTATTTTKEPDLTYVHNKSDGKGTFTFAYATPLSTFDTGSAMESAQTDWLRINLTFKTQATSNTTASVECIMSGGKLQVGDKISNIELGDVSANAKLSHIGTYATGMIDGQKVRIKEEGNSKITIELDSGKSGLKEFTKITGITGFNYVVDSTTHPIREINITGETGNAISFDAINNSAINGWVWGDKPTQKADGGEAEPENPENNNEDPEDNSNNEDDGDEGDIFN